MQCFAVLLSATKAATKATLSTGLAYGLLCALPAVLSGTRTLPPGLQPILPPAGKL